ncbi:MAG: HEAT repeat domain-containing protein [Planctomycetota bacterium]|jgi:hypothetical protein|nr:HEAT repeat domain-containing protein [Planctomycetota bacterium]
MNIRIPRPYNAVLYGILIFVVVAGAYFIQTKPFRIAAKLTTFVVQPRASTFKFDKSQLLLSAYLSRDSLLPLLVDQYPSSKTNKKIAILLIYGECVEQANWAGYEKALPHMLEALQAEDQILVDYAVVALSKLEHLAVDPLTAFIRKNQDQERLLTTAIDALGQTGSSRASAPLASLLLADPGTSGVEGIARSTNPSLREHAADKLGLFDQPDAILALGKALEDEEESIRETARNSLIPMKNPAVAEAIQVALKSPVREARTAALEIIRQRKDIDQIRHAVQTWKQDEFVACKAGSILANYRKSDADTVLGKTVFGDELEALKQSIQKDTTTLLRLFDKVQNEENLDVLAEGLPNIIVPWDREELQQRLETATDAKKRHLVLLIGRGGKRSHAIRGTKKHPRSKERERYEREYKSNFTDLFIEGLKNSSPTEQHAYKEALESITNCYLGADYRSWELWKEANAIENEILAEFKKDFNNFPQKRSRRLQDKIDRALRIYEGLADRTQGRQSFERREKRLYSHKEHIIKQTSID